MRQPAGRQRYFNRASQASWQAFAAHREQVAARLNAFGTLPSLCVLGAGNCNDLDLVRLTAHWPEIRLVDIDVEAMHAGVARQLFGRSPRIEITACDLTGALEHCHAPMSREAIARLRSALTLLPAVAQMQRQFSTVASTCVLSQLIDIVRHAIGPESPELPALADLVRLQHLRTLAELTTPGGTMLLFADVVSSDTQPALLDAPDSELAGILDRVLRERAHFTGMNPVAIVRLLQQPQLAAYWESPPVMSAPWRWNLGPRTYLVTVISCRRRHTL